MKLGFTGSSKYVTEAQKSGFIFLVSKLLPSEFHHGDCIQADALAHDLILQYVPDCDILIHPPDNNTKRAYCENYSFKYAKKPYLDRNKDIVMDTEALIALPDGEEVLRSGTWSTVRFARKLNRPIWIIYPDGEVLRG